MILEYQEFDFFYIKKKSTLILDIKTICFVISEKSFIGIKFECDIKI